MKFKLLISCAYLISLLCIANCSAQPATVHILGINDFHGQLIPGLTQNDRPVGGAAVLAAYLKSESDANTLIALSGDQTGASPSVSSLLNHEPTMIFLNSLANANCTPQTLMDSHCNMVATLGNHDFDRGVLSLRQLLDGSAPTHAYADYHGAVFPHISANIVDAQTGKLIFPAYVIKEINGIRIGFIGVILKDTPSVSRPENYKGLQFLDEADSINQFIPEIKAQGADIIVVIIHQGGEQTPYTGPTHDTSPVNGPIVDIVKKLDDRVDVVMAGHRHNFINANLPNAHGKSILVTEAESYSKAFTKIDLIIDPKTHQLLSKSARIITTYADIAPGNQPDIQTQTFVNQAEEKIAPITQRTIGTLKGNLTRNSNVAGESSLGDFAADAARYNMHTDMAILNPGSLRADLQAGVVTWGMLDAVYAIKNTLEKVTLTGQQIHDLLEQQWQLASGKIIILQISGLIYTYNPSKLLGHRVINIQIGQQPLENNKRYTVTTNDFLINGGDGFSVMKQAQLIETGNKDLESLLTYIPVLPQPIESKKDIRIKKIGY